MNTPVMTSSPLAGWQNAFNAVGGKLIGGFTTQGTPGMPGFQIINNPSHSVGDWISMVLGGILLLVGVIFMGLSTETGRSTVKTAGKIASASKATAE